MLRLKLKEAWLKSKALVLIVFFLFLSSCLSRTERLVSSAERAEQNEDFFKAISLYEKAYEVCKHKEEEEKKEKCIEIIKKLADIYLINLKNPKQSLYWLDEKAASLSSTDQIIATQKRRVRILLDHMGDYQKTVIEIQKLLSYEMPIAERCEIIYDLGMAHYQLTHFDEVLMEIKNCLGNIPINKALFYKLATLEIDTLMAQKKHQQVIYNAGLLLQDYDVDEDKKRALLLTQALAYEEQGDFTSARNLIEGILKKARIEDRSYFLLRLERLKMRESQQAGARLKKKRR